MSAPSSAASSLVRPTEVPITAPGWYYVGGKPGELACKADSVVSFEALSEVKADEQKVVPIQPKFLAKFGHEKAAAMFNAQTIVALTRSSSVKMQNRKGKGKKNGFKAIVFNPQASRPQPTLKTPYQEFHVTGEYASTLFTTSTGVPTNGAESYTLSAHFPDVSSYTGLFDEYRIDQVEVWLDPAIVMSGSTGGAPFISAVDLDDANTPANFADVGGRQGAIESTTGTGHYHKWKPHVATALYSGAFTSYGSVTSMWIDCASPSVQHFGLKWATNSADGVARPYYRTVRLSVTFRGPAI